MLVSTVRPNLNAVATVPAELDRAVASTGFCVLRAKTDLADPRYIFFRARSPAFVEALTAIAQGGSYPAVTDADIKSQRIPLPTPTEQRRVADFLDQADRLRQLRAEADAKAERIVPALFLSMFGDPATNPMRWARNSFIEVFEDITSECAKIPRRAYRSEGQFPIVDQGRGTMVAGYSDDLEACYQGPSAVIVFGDHTRAVKYVEPPFVAGADGSRILRARPGLEPSFLATQLLLQQIPDRGYSRHMRLVKRLSFIAPDSRLQQRFAGAFRSVQALLGEQRRSSCRLDRLAKSLHAPALLQALTAHVGEEDTEETTLSSFLTQVSQRSRRRIRDRREAN